MNLLSIAPYNRNVYNCKPEKAMSGSDKTHKVISNNNPLHYFEGIKNYNLAMIAFKGDGSVENTPLFRHFKVKYQGNPQKVLDYVLTSNAQPVQLIDFLTAVFKDPEYAQPFFRQLTSEPKKSRELSKQLINQLGGIKAFKNWYFSAGGYSEAYHQYIDKFYEQAKSIDDLIKQSPNWTIWSLKNKSEHLSGNKHFTLGLIPEQIGDELTYKALIDRLRQYPSGQIDINGKTFTVKHLRNGLSDKTNFIVSTGDRQFVIKVGPVMENEFHRDNADMKSDSCFITAQIDYYLALHNCPNAAKLHYYDHSQNSSVYEFVTGSQKDDSVPLPEMNKKIKPVNDLGIFVNDSFLSNFIKRGEDYILIDSGESSFIDVLRPGCVGYHFDLPNLSGRSVLSGLAGMALATGMLD